MTKKKEGEYLTIKDGYFELRIFVGMTFGEWGEKVGRRLLSRGGCGPCALLTGKPCNVFIGDEKRGGS